MKQERNVVDPFSPVISFTISSLARSTRSLSEVWGSRQFQWYALFSLGRIRPSRRLRNDGGLSSPDGPHGALAESAIASRADQTEWCIRMASGLALGKQVSILLGPHSSIAFCPSSIGGAQNTQ